LGSDGCTLIDLCRSSGASIALRPVLQDVGDDGFVLEISGPAGAVESARSSMSLLFAEEDQALAHEGVKDENASGEEGPDEDEERDASDRDDPEADTDILGECSAEAIEVEFPRHLSDMVISERTPGAKGAGKAQGLLDMKQITGVRELHGVKAGRNKEMTQLRAEGETAALRRFKELLEARLAAVEDMRMELFEVPRYALALLWNDAAKEAFEIEKASGTMLGIQGPKDKVRQTAHISIRGAAEQIEHAKELVLERITRKKRRGSKGKDNGKDKGKGKGKGKGKNGG